MTVKKLLAFTIVVLFATAALATVQEDFYNYRASENATAMLGLINILKNEPDLTSSATTLKVLADACVEYGLWGAPKKEKASYFNEAIKYSSIALKMTPDDAYLNFVKGAAIGRLAQYKGIFQSMFMLGDFDHFINKSIKLDPKLYRAYVALGMRYRDTPWPFANFGKAEGLFKKALEIDPNYVYGYYELAQLYLKWNKVKKARQIFEKIVSMPVEKEFFAQEKQNQTEAKEWLNAHK